MKRSRFAVLWRAFFAQFFASDTISSEEQLQLTIAGLIGFLLVPGLFLLVELFFDYQGIVLRAIRYQQFEYLTDTLEWIALVFITYSAVSVGIIGAYAWDALVFDQRDAMVLGPLPLPRTTIVTAKLAAVASLMLVASVAVNAFNAFVFAFETADRLGAVVFARHFVAHLTATCGAAVFVFCTIVVLRGVVGTVAGVRVATVVGSIVQFIFVLAVLGVVILCPAVWKVPHRELVNFTVTNALPTSWFLGVFEWIRGSDRWYVRPLVTRAVVGTAAALAAAGLTSLLGFYRHMRTSLAPSARTGIGGARFPRWIARRLTRTDSMAAATADFVVLTLARNRAQQTLVAMNVAVAIALVLAALAQIADFTVLTRPHAVVLWIPLVFGFCSIVGLRAAFFVPAELTAAWIFRADGAPSREEVVWSAARAVLLACVLPPTVAIALLVTAPALGWAVAAEHAAFVVAATIAMIEIAAPTVSFVPFTRPYQPGRAKLRTRWWLYVLGLYASAVWPVRLELWALERPLALPGLIALFAVVGAGLNRVGRRRSVRASSLPEEAPHEVSGFTVLDINVVLPGVSES